MPNWKKIVTSGSDATLNSLTVTNGITGSLEGTASYAIQALSASWAPTPPSVSPFPFTGSAQITGSLGVTGSITVLGTGTVAQFGATGLNGVFIQNSVSNTGLITAVNNTPADPNASAISSGANFGLNGSSTNFYGIGLGALRNSKYDIWFQTGNTNGGGYRWYTGGVNERMTMDYLGNLGIGKSTPSVRLDVAGTTRISGSFNTAISGTILTVVGSGSSQPIFTVQGSQGELFSTSDSLSGSLFSVNDISGLPILEVFSDNTTVVGDYQSPMLLTTKRVIQSNSGSFVVYSIPTASYDSVFIEYNIKSGSNARAGTIMSTWVSSSIQFSEVDTMDIGNTSVVGLTMILSGSNAVLTGSSSTGAWIIKTIIRSI